MPSTTSAATAQTNPQGAPQLKPLTTAPAMLLAPINCNLLFVGQTGTGKSSLADYLFDTAYFTTSAGKPATGWTQGLQVYTLDASGINVNLFHAIDFDPGTCAQWIRNLDAYLTTIKAASEEDLLPSNVDIHAVFYTLHAADEESNDKNLAAIEALQGICRKHGLLLAIAITNCDKTEEEAIEKLERAVKKRNLRAIRLCAAAQDGQPDGGAARFGKEPMVDRILTASYEQVGVPLTMHVLIQTMLFLQLLKKELKPRLYGTKMSVMQENSINNGLKAVATDIQETFIDDYNRGLLAQYRGYAAFLKGFHTENDGLDTVNDCLTDIDEALAYLHPRHLTIESIIDRTQDDTVIRGNMEMAKAVLALFNNFLRIRHSLKNDLDVILNLYIERLNNHLEAMRRIAEYR